MSLSTQCRLGQQFQLWQVNRTVSLKRPFHTYTTVSCNGVRRWSPVEQGKEKAQRLEQKAQQLEQAVMPDTQNLCVQPKIAWPLQLGILLIHLEMEKRGLEM